jgi:2-succinyl-5-enolpyruvyl-6-hydroxy-3-cyclohexene-1-carboxylate synthase
MNCIKESDNINQLWSNIIVEELVRHKITYFCISPGSRSTPLTVAAARHAKVNCKIIYDERGAAFHALGYARAANNPAVLICTSGTAVANYYPAVIEAYQENIPLIILSADRPPELRGRGANQTIDQINIFGRYTHHFTDLPCPSTEYVPSYVLKEINRAVEKSLFPFAGPVHVNCMFREPLAPKKESWPPEYLKEIQNWLDGTETFTKLEIKTSEKYDKVQIEKLIQNINKNNNGIILAGRCEKTEDQQAILDLAEKISWPVFADITSGLRLNNKSNKIIHYFDQLLLSEKIKREMKHLPLVHFGGQFVSRKLFNFLKNFKGEHIHIMSSDKIVDPAHSVTMRINNSICGVIRKILTEIDIKTTSGHDSLFEYNQKVKQCIPTFLAGEDKINEIAVTETVTRNIFNESTLFIASSMPIRDMDMFAIPGNGSIKIGANRGASGIDGTIASSVGFANGHKKAMILVIGDLAFIHDLNSLSMLRECENPVLIILINNQGGGIFSFLPISDHQDVFEKNFATPHQFTFEKIAEMFGLKYFNPKTCKDFENLFSQYQYSKKATLIEVKTNRRENLELHNSLQKYISTHLPG